MSKIQWSSYTADTLFGQVESEDFFFLIAYEPQPYKLTTLTLCQLRDLDNPEECRCRAFDSRPEQTLAAICSLMIEAELKCDELLKTAEAEKGVAA